MKNYICPKCGGHLSIDNEIIFLTKNNKGDSALVLLSAEIGNYSFRKNDKVNFAAGDHVNFICPICYENLNAEEYDNNLAKVIMIDEDGKESNIVFSKILGEKATYSIHEKGVDAFGDHKDNYLGKL
ncbi:MAG: hypothetical protein JXR36_08880 [Bacteroidales bacterium]|jgi:hypothetical protein|nr:hypothetical protein [Bacteroidales bacterium]